ncbi:MAG: DUF2510 domain-containing protein [Pseudonocardiales bacterium]
MVAQPARPGWYEDPSGEPGLFAFWDGAEWGERTREAPVGAALPLRSARPPGAHNSRVGAILAVAVALFVVAAAVVLLTR